MQERRVGIDTWESAEPIFGVPGRQVHPVTSVASVDCDGTAAHLRLTTRGGPDLHARVTFAAPAVARIQWCIGRSPAARTTEMLVGPAPELPLSVEETSERVAVHAGGPPLVWSRRGWDVRFGAARLCAPDRSAAGWVAEPAGVVRGDGDGDDRTLLTFALAPGEELFGLGERFLGPRLRGRRLGNWIADTIGTNTTDAIYKTVPLIVSTSGYGLFVQQSEPTTYDLGALSSCSASVLIESPQLDLFVIDGSPADVLREYTALTGRPSEPPEWTYGVWMSRCYYRSRAEIEAVLDDADRLGIDVGVVHVDPLWLRNHWTSDVCDFVVNTNDFGSLPDFAESLHARNVRLCLWVNPYLNVHSEAWKPELLVSGGDARDAVDGDRGFIDFTGAGAGWWQERIGDLVAMGVDAVKLDYGEGLPATAHLADGRDGREMHTMYPLLAAQATARAGMDVTFTRAGTAGSQRYPLHWSGDAQSTWEGLEGSLRGGLSAAWSGFAHWTTDIGGFHGRRPPEVTGAERLTDVPPEPELFIRWMQMGMLLSHTRFHGTTPREPWAYGDAAVEGAKRLIALRAALTPYLMECATEAARTGIPLLRPQGLQFPDERGGWAVDSGYLLGPSLAVAPVLQPGGIVDVHVPPGLWRDAFTGERFEGPRWVRHRGVPLDRFPLLVREDQGDLWGRLERRDWLRI